MSATDAESSPNVVKTGTVTVGIKIKDGVLLAADQRATMGNYIAGSHVQKVYQLADNLGMTISGSVGDAQLMIRYMQSELAIYKMEKGALITVQTAATYLGRAIRGFYMAPIIAGYDKTGGHVFSVDMAGGVLEDDYISSGSGEILAYGVLEAQYKPGMSKKDGIDVLIAALNSARRRDVYNGDGMIMAYIGPKGFEWIPREDLKARYAELGFAYPN
ncbi:MAG: proteasome subunit beta [Methanomethylophilus sp.]